jgi:ssDNA-binding Zn-finger/Zn-ribbon topoisomerase 1
MDKETLTCPNCGKTEGIVFMGMKQNGKGNFVKQYECVNCDTEWAEEFDGEERQEFNS